MASIAYRAFFYLPVVSSFIAVSLIWLWMYEPQFGFFNDLLEAVGLPRLKWLRVADTSMLSIILLSVWKNMGLNMVIYLAGLQGIPPHLYEAAEIDGAGRYAEFRRITLPLLAPTTYFVVIVYFIGALQMFVQVFIMTSGSGNELFGGPLDSTITVVILILRQRLRISENGLRRSHVVRPVSRDCRGDTPKRTPAQVRNRLLGVDTVRARDQHPPHESGR